MVMVTGAFHKFVKLILYSTQGFMRDFYVANHWNLSNYVSMYQHVMWAVTPL